MSFDLALDEGHQAVADLFERFFANESPIAVVRDAEPLGFAPELWRRFGEIGGTSMGAAEASGGGGATMRDLVLMAEMAGRTLAPIPLIDHIVATRFGPTPELLGGDAIAALAVRPADKGNWRLVPAGAVARCVLGLDGDEFIAILSTPPGVNVRNHANAPVADRSAVTGERHTIGGRAQFEQALMEWKILTAAALGAVARRALEIATDYAKTRIQFGRPIGAFQAVQQGLADCVAHVEGAQILARKAAWATDAGRDGDCDIDRGEIHDPAVLASMAFVFAAEAAAHVTKKAVQYHGSYGFSAEYDIQLYYRRARGWPLLLGPLSHERACLAARLLAAPKTSRCISRFGPMNFELPPSCLELREEVRAVIAEAVTEEHVRTAHETGTNSCLPLHRALGARGLIERAVTGLGTGEPIDAWVVMNELETAAVPHDAVTMVMAAAAVINKVGTDLQKRELLPGLLAGDKVVCFGLTEPNVGSDLPAISTRSTQDGDEWVINGAKMWTTMSHVADWCLLLTRSDPAAERYQGYTFFFLPMHLPGISIEPIWTMGAERSNAVFFDGVRVSSRYILGEPQRGWATLSVMLSLERGVGGTGYGVPLVRRAAAWALESGAIDDPFVRDALARTAIDNEVTRLLTQRTIWLANNGAPNAAVAGSTAKVFASEAYQRNAGALQDLLSPASLLGMDEPDGAAGGWLDYDVRHAVPQTLQGGTSEINRNNIAERGLGLPRAR